MAQLKQTRLQLTIILSSIVALLFLVIGESFFSFKFITDKSSIQKEIQKIETTINNQEAEIQSFVDNNSNWETNTNTQNDISKILDFTSALFANPETNFEDIGEKNDVDDIIIKWKSDFEFFDHTVIFYNSEDKEVLYSNIWENNEIDINAYINDDDWLKYWPDLAQYKFTLEA